MVKYLATVKVLLLHLLLFLFVQNSLYAQVDVVDSGHITTGERIFEYEQVIGDSSRTFGTIYERIKQIAENDIIEITILQELPNATLTDSILVQSESFLPIHYRSIVPQFQDIKVNYSIPGSTVIDMYRNIPNQLVDTTLYVHTAGRMYDYHWPHLLLYILSPLEMNDDVINLPVFTYQNKKSMQSISYKGTEPIELYGQKYDAIVWKTVIPHSGTENIYWIDQSTNRLLQSKATISNGTIFWFRMKEKTG